MSPAVRQLTGIYQPARAKVLYYGSGAVAKHLLDTLPSKDSKAFIITGNSLATKTDLIKKVEKILGDRHVGTFSKIAQHAPIKQLDEAADLVLKEKGVDTVISIGGGSPIDSAKIISKRVHDKKGEYLWHVTVPTTISAAECTALGGYSDEKGVKSLEKDPNILPSAIIYDSSFVLETPPHLVTSTGMRALDHATEIMYHPEASEWTRLMAMQAAAKLFKYLPLYNQNPKDEAIIIELLLGAYASLGFLGLVEKGLGLSHALGYALGSPYGIPHGVTSCITLSAVVRLKTEQDADAAREIARLAPFVGASKTGDDKKDSEAVADAIQKLVDELGLTTKLKDKGVGEDQIPVIAKRATGKEEGPEFDRLKVLVKSLL